MFIAVRILNTFTEHMRELLRIYFLFSIFFYYINFENIFMILSNKSVLNQNLSWYFSFKYLL